MTSAGKGNGSQGRGPGSPWLVGIPLYAGAMILGVLWVVGSKPIYFVAAVFVLAWAVLWVWGASRGRRADARASAARPYTAPRPGDAVVLGRARWSVRGGLRQRQAGVLLAGSGELLWVAGDLSLLGHIGQTVPLGALLVRAGADGGRGVKAQTVVALEDLRSYRMVSGAFGADRLTLHLRDGRSTTLRGMDPEVLVLLTEVFAGLAEDDEGDRPSEAS